MYYVDTYYSIYIYTVYSILHIHIPSFPPFKPPLFIIVGIAPKTYQELLACLPEAFAAWVLVTIDHQMMAGVQGKGAGVTRCHMDMDDMLGKT